VLTCKELTELVTSYLEGHLSFFDRMRFTLHLRMCPHCRAYMKQMEATIDRLGSLPEETISPDVCQQMIERFRDWKRQSRCEASHNNGGPA
jgi:anti-sigma factor RsiW